MPKFLTTLVTKNSDSVKVFVQEEAPVSIPEYDSEIYSIILKDSENNTYGKMSYSIGPNYLEILSLDKLDPSTKYVGTALVEWVLQKSYEIGKNGNLELTSDYGSYVFWYPLGFRSKDEEENLALAHLIARRKSEIPVGERLVQVKEAEESLSFTFMYLPEKEKLALYKKFQNTTKPHAQVSLNFFAHKDDQEVITSDVVVRPPARAAAFGTS